MMFNFPNIQEILFSLPPLLLALSFHEFAHAFVADRMGDSTARHYGRLTVNPLRHLDPIGTLLLVFYHFGWAKPVPVNPFNFRNKKWGMFFVSLAGPGSNFLLALLTVVASHYIGIFTSSRIIAFMIYVFVDVNIFLAAFNLIPFPPLDGSKILFSLLPQRYAYRFEKLETYGPVLLILLAFTNTLNIILYPIHDYLYYGIQLISNLIFKG